MKKIIAIIFLFCTALRISAEYRAYQYYVKATHPYALDQKSYLVISTLNPIAYQAYHGGRVSLNVDLIRSWMCFGSTAGKRPCLPPWESFINEVKSPDNRSRQ